VKYWKNFFSGREAEPDFFSEQKAAGPDFFSEEK
jgi:hypothetical protein